MEATTDHPLMRKLFAAGVVACLLAACTPAEQAYVHVAVTRSAAHLPSLCIDQEAEQLAEWWVHELATSGDLRHSFSTRFVTDWTRVGETVGYGGSVEVVHDAFLASPTHRAIILDPDYDCVGVGVEETAQRVWVVYEFVDRG